MYHIFNDFLRPLIGRGGLVLFVLIQKGPKKSRTEKCSAAFLFGPTLVLRLFAKGLEGIFVMDAAISCKAFMLKANNLP